MDLRPCHVLSGALLLGAFGLPGCGQTEPAAVREPAGLTVTTEAVRVDTLRDVANASGQVVPSAAGDWTIVASEVAEIAELPKKAGDAVAIGDLLVKLDIPALTHELSAAELGVLEATSRLDRAKAELTRQTALFERGITSRNTFDTSRLEVSAAETNLLQSRTRFDALRSGENRATVRASFSGVVTEVYHNVGDTVRPSEVDPILRVIDPSRLQVTVDLALSELARVVPGQVATVKAVAGLAAEPGTVVSKIDAVAVGLPTGQARIAFVNTPTLPVNTAVSVEIVLDQRTNALVVPTNAVRRDDLGPYVMVAGDDQRAHRRDVRLGLSTSALSQAVAGLSAGEFVIVSSLADIQEGSPIVVAR